MLVCCQDVTQTAPQGASAFLITLILCHSTLIHTPGSCQTRGGLPGVMLDAGVVSGPVSIPAWQWDYFSTFVQDEGLSIPSSSDRWLEGMVLNDLENFCSSTIPSRFVLPKSSIGFQGQTSFFFLINPWRNFLNQIQLLNSIQNHATSLGIFVNNDVKSNWR